MSSNLEESKIVFCVPDREQYNDPEQGSIRPVFEELNGELFLSDTNNYINNKRIHVTKGYKSKFSNAKPNDFFKVQVSISRSWTPLEKRPGIAKYVTYDRLVEPAKYLDISMVIDAHYPEPSKVGGMSCTLHFIPTDGFFIKCFTPDNLKALVGPLDVDLKSVKSSDGMHTFSYNAPDKPFGGKWKKINEVSHSTLLFDITTVKEGLIVTDNDQEYLINNEKLPFESALLLDISTDENIVKWASKLIRITGAATTSQLSNLKTLLQEIPKDAELPLRIWESRKKRINLLTEKLSKTEGFGQILSDYMNSHEGQTTIKQHVEANRDNLLDKYFEDEVAKVYIEANAFVETEVSNKKKTLTQLNKDVIALEFKQEEIKSSKHGVELSELQAKVDSLRVEYEIILDFNVLKVEKEAITKEIQSLIVDQEKAESLLLTIQQGINESEESSKLKLIELKRGLDAISGNFKTEADLKTHVLTNMPFYKVESGKQGKIDVITRALSALESKGRIVSFDEVAILITCIMQNLIVTLAGKPGSGKSSMVSELADVLSLKNNGKYVHLQVQRGWSSDRDILGFYNKLSQAYEPDRFGLYKLINGLQHIDTSNQFSIALLDEANLSPIEHYWSGFMGANDDYKCFSTQGSKLTLPKGLRFITTVNYDRTTEPLSARFLDRSPVIYLKNQVDSLLSKSKSVSEINYSDSHFSYVTLIELFENEKIAEFTGDEVRIMEEILDEYQFLPINHRKINSIRNFTHTLRDVFNDESSSPLKAYDLSLLVNVIPLINGQGRTYKQLLEKFQTFLKKQGLNKSEEKLTNIIQNGMFDSYSYFS
jgi:hypothetical protein